MSVESQQPLHKAWSNVRNPFDVIAVAASFGGLQALTVLLGILPADFPTPIVVVQHLSPHSPARWWRS